MRTILALALLLTGSALVRAQEVPQTLPPDIVELSPDLYLLTNRARLEGAVDAQLDAFRRANEFAAQRGGVVVPIVGRMAQVGLTLKVFQYQFRVMSREQALALRPVLADAVITVNNSGQCAPNPAVQALLPDLHGIDALNHLDLLARLPRPPADETGSPDQAPGTTCLPGQVCQPAQQCLPGWKCTPGMPPSQEPPPASTPPAS